MLRNLFFILTLASTGLSSLVQAQDALPAGPSAFVLIARLHALPGQADQVVALSAAGGLGCSSGGVISRRGAFILEAHFGFRSESTLPGSASDLPLAGIVGFGSLCRSFGFRVREHSTRERIRPATSRNSGLRLALQVIWVSG